MKRTCLMVLGAALALSVHNLNAQEQAPDQKSFNPEALKQLAERGNPDAQFEMGIRFLGGEGMPKDEKKAAEWLLKAADQQNLPAMNALGTLSEEGVGVAKDPKKAFEWYEKAAKYGFPLAQQNLAECYDLGKGVEKNEQEGLKWLLRAASQDSPPAQAQYAWKLEHGKGGLQKNLREASQWYLKAAQQGLVIAMTHLAYLYCTGQGVPLDYRHAEAWYRRAARSEDPWAHNDLAWFLSTCPDENFHDGDTALEFARSAVDKVKGARYEVADTLAAALARSGNFGEAVQIQVKAITDFSKDKEKEMSPEERTKLEKELTERLGDYRKRRAYTDKEPEPEANTKPLVEDRILQEELPRRKKKPTEKPESRSVEIS